MAEYVVKSWATNEAPTGGPHIIIEGRVAGFLPWLLGVIKIDPGMNFIVTAEKIIYKQGGAAGHLTSVTALENVCSTHYGMKKPWLEALLLGLLIGALTLFAFGIPGVLIGILYYITKTSITLGFCEISGQKFTLVFRRAMLGGMAIDTTKAATTCNLMQQLVDSKLRKGNL